MFVNFETKIDWNAATQELRALAAIVLNNVSPIEGEKRLPASTLVSKGDASRSYRLVDGWLKLRLGAQELIVFEAGDIVGWQCDSHSEMEIWTPDVGVIAEEFDTNAIRKAVDGNEECRNAWLSYLSRYGTLVTRVAAELVTVSETPLPAIRNFQEGDVIIEQGSSGKEVYTLIEGSAEARVNGVRVGSIEVSEFFGTLSAITGNPRSASVVAVTDCMVLGINPDEFLPLIKSRPDLTLKLLNDMARIVVDCNAALVKGK